MAINTTINTSPTFSNRTIDRFAYKLRYNVQTFLELYQYFIQNNLQAIIGFYQDSAANVDKESFDFLARLITEVGKIKTLIKINKSSFRGTDDWELLDFIETIDSKLQTINNTDKWTRSSKTQNAWQGNVLQTSQVLGDDQTLENLSESIYGGSTAQDDWMRIALENNLSERDYGVNSSNLIQLTKKSLSSPNYSLSSIVDNLVNQKLYGLDFNRKITFVNNDIAVLSYNNTVVQACEILITLKKGDHPEFSSLGVDPQLAVGSSFGSLKFSSIVRQLEDTFATDDSLRNFQVTNVDYSNGALNISYQVDTFYDLTYGNTTSIIQQ